MGNKLDRLGGYEDRSSSSSPQERNIDDIAVSSSSDSRKRPGQAEDSPTTKIRKLDTAKYVYERLFEKGEGSDLTIHALGRIWNLHKFYLQQCRYFEAILNGNWKESNDNAIHLNVCDENVTADGLDAVFASLYLNEIEINLEKIEGILAAAFLIGLDSVVSRCEDVMIENLSQTTLLRFHDVAQMYGLVHVEKKAVENLKRMFWKFMRNRMLLREISESLLSSLLSSTELLVVEGEMDLYRMVKSWIFLHEDPSSVDMSEDEFQNKAHEYFRESEINTLFIKYSSLFSPLRMHHFLTSTASIRMIENDNLIPQEVVTSILTEQWSTLLKNEENPTIINEITDETFNSSCLRLGRLIESLPKCWRWTGFNYGIDVLIHITNKTIIMKRNCLNQPTTYSINLKSDRKIYYRLAIVDSLGQPIYDSQNTSVSLRPDQTTVITRLGENVVLPISVHFNYLAISPPPPSSILVDAFVNRNQ